MEPVSTAAMLGVAGINALGGLLTGRSQAQTAQADLAERRRQFQETQRWLREQMAAQQAIEQQRANQQDRQFRSTWQQNEDQFGAGFNQRDNQFGANFAQSENQFGANYGQRERQFGADFDRGERQFGANFDRDERQFGAKFGQDERMYADKSAFDRAKYQDERAQAAIGVQRALNMAPLNDQALFMLQARAGATPGTFQARDYTRGSIAGAGAPTGGSGSILSAQQAAAGRYQPGMGGFDTSAMRNALRRYNDPSTLPAAYRAQTYTPGSYTPGTYTPGPAYRPTTYTPQAYTPRTYPGQPQADPPPPPPPAAGDGASGGAGGGGGGMTAEEQAFINRFMPYLNQRVA